MTRDEMADLFEEHHDEYLKFERIENPPFQQPDLCALVKLAPFCGKGNIIGCAEHDIFYIDPGAVETFLEAATEEDVIYLLRCGVHWDSEFNSLALFA